MTTALQTGNSQIVAYELYWDAGTDSTNILLDRETSATSFTQNSLVPGKEYLFYVRAQNIYGYGEFSYPIVLIPSQNPATMVAPASTLDWPFIEMRFTAPFDNGNEIDAY